MSVRLSVCCWQSLANGSSGDNAKNFCNLHQALAQYEYGHYCFTEAQKEVCVPSTTKFAVDFNAFLVPVQYVPCVSGAAPG